MNKIERGNTQDGVNAHIIKSILPRHFAVDQSFSLLDFPCGDGTFLAHLQNIYRKAALQGADPFATPKSEVSSIFVAARSDDWSSFNRKSMDAITCISGVMCFDNLTDYFAKASEHLKPGGLLVVTNDNFLTVRDRLSLLFFGRVKRFKKLYARNEGNWNMVPIQALWKLYKQNDFDILDVTYTSARAEDYLFLPLALLLYPIEFTYLISQRSELSLQERLALFPIQSLYARHYVILGRKRAPNSRP